MPLLRLAALPFAALLALAQIPSARADGIDDLTAPTRRVHGAHGVDYALRADCGWNVIDRDSGRLVAALPRPAPKATCDDEYDAAASPDDRWLASSHGIWDVRGKRWVMKTGGFGFAFSGDGRYLAYVERPPKRDPEALYAHDGRIVLRDLRKATVRFSPRVIGVLSNGTPLEFLGGSRALLLTDYALTLFSMPALEPRAVDWKDLARLTATFRGADHEP